MLSCSERSGFMEFAGMDIRADLAPISRRRGRRRFVDHLPGDNGYEYLAADFEPDERSVLALALERRRLDPPVARRIEDADVGGGRNTEVTRIASENRGRLRRDPGKGFRQCNA